MENDKKQLTVSFNYKTVLLLLTVLYLVTVTVMLYLWQPWNTSLEDARKITVTGEATIQAEPDEFQFSPSYNLESDSKDGVLQKAADKSNEVVDGLKKLGLEDKDIKVSGSTQDWYWYQDDDGANRASVSITVTVGDKDMAQKVQDYLLTTEAEGQLTPWPTFSEEKSKELEVRARQEAIADAKTKAQASADELEVRVGQVISVDEGYGFGDYPVAYDGLDVVESSQSGRSIPVQPGEDEYTYSVTVVFEIK